MNNERRAAIGKLLVQVEHFDKLPKDEFLGGWRTLISARYVALRDEFEGKWNDLKSMCDELVGECDEIAAEVESIRDEEQEAFDSMPEGLQQSERGQASESAISSLDDAFNALRAIADWELPDLEFPDLDETLNEIDNVTTGLEQASGE